MALRDVVNRIRKNKQEEYLQKYMRCSLTAVDFDDSCRVANRPRFMWVREYNNPNNLFIAYGPDTQDTVNLPVRVTRNKQPPHFRRTIVEVDYSHIDDNVPISSYEAHARNHEWPDTAPGSDVMNVYPRAIFPISIRRQSGLVLYITPGIYKYGDVSYKFYGAQIDLTDYLPTTGNAIRVCIYLTPVTNVVSGYSSTEVISTLEPAYTFPVATHIIPVGWVKLLYNTTTILESAIVDARAFLDAGVSGGGTIDDHPHDGTANSGGRFPLINLTSNIGIYPVDVNYVPVSDGTGEIIWTEFSPTLQDHNHTNTPGDGGSFAAINLTSYYAGLYAAPYGYVFTADGAGGTSWEENPALVNRLQAVFTVEGALSTGTGFIRIANHTGRTLTILGVYLDCSTAPTGAAIIVDINKNGTTVFTTQSNRPQIAVSAFSGNSTTIQVPTWSDGQYLTMDIDQIGSTVSGSNLTVTIVYM